MSGSVAVLQPDPAPIVACTIARDVSNFDLLIEDMEAELGESWGDLTFDDAAQFFRQPEASALEFVCIAVDSDDEGDLPRISGIVTLAKEMGLKVILITEEISPMALHQLLRLGADDFVPYPLPENALHDAIERMHKAPPPAEKETSHALTLGGGNRRGVILPVQGVAGGVGATTFAVNLAWEIATVQKKDGPRVCLIDLDFQHGAIATYLDLPRREAVYELLSDMGSADGDALMQAMQSFQDRMHVLTAPSEMLPLDLVSPDDIARLLDLARAQFDFVVIDMPTTVVQWTETVLHQAQLYFVPLELDMRSAQNTLRMIRALKSEELPVEKLRFVLNRAPGFTELSARGRVKRLCESLDIDVEVQLPDGGKPVTQSNDHGLPLSETAAKNPLRKEIQKLAKSLHDLGRAAETART